MTTGYDWMDKQGLDDLFTKVKVALGEHAARAVDGNNDISARIAEIRDTLGEVIDRAASERAKSVGLADAVKERLKALEESIPRLPSEEDKERLAKLEKSLGERSDEVVASKKRIAQLEKALSEHAESEQHAARTIAALEKELLERNEATQAATHRIAELESQAAAIPRERLAELEKTVADARNAGKASEEKQKALWDQVSAEKSATEAASRRVSELEVAVQDARGELESLRKERQAERKNLDEANISAREADNLARMLEAEKERANALDRELVDERKKSMKSVLAQQLTEALKDREDTLEEAIRLRAELATLRNEAQPAGPGPAKPKDKIEEKIRQAAAPDSEEARKRMGDILVDAGVITGKQLEDAIAEQREFPMKRLGAILVEKRFASEDVVAQALAFQRNVEFVRIKAETIDTAAAKLISGRLAEHHGCIPISTFRGKMTLAMINPLDLIAIEDVERASNHQVDPVVATSTDIINWIREIYD